VIRVALAGATGHVGRPLAEALEAAGDIELAARVAPSLAGAGPGTFGSVTEALGAVRPEVVIDFTRPDVVVAHALLSIEAGASPVLGTTGLAESERSHIHGAAEAAGIPAFWAPNFALGAVLMMRFAREAARHLPRAEIVELHGEHKRDAPSGTAALTADLIDSVAGREPVIHSVRLPGLVAHQEVLFGGEGQLLTIRHDSFDRTAFVPGVLLAVRRVALLRPGLTIGLDAVLEESEGA
jgi:4-hydroxy-tetrahydrodipicolinate reductase